MKKSSTFKPLYGFLPDHYKVIFVVLLLLAIGLFTIGVGIQKRSIDAIFNTDFRVVASQNNLVFYKKDSDEAVVKISPFDDYYYRKDKKNHLALKTQKTQEQDYFLQILNTFNAVFLNNQLNLFLAISNKDFAKSITYEVFIGEDNAIQVVRKFPKGLPDNVTAIGQSVVFSNQWLVTDSSKNLYLRGGLFNDNNLNIADTLHLTPVILTNDQSLPQNTSYTVIDSRGEKKFTITPLAGDLVWYDQDFGLLEIKQDITKTHRFTLQIINL